MSKTRNWPTRAIYMVIALVMTLGLLMVPAAGVVLADTEVCGSLGTCGGDTAEWVAGQTHVGAYTPLLTKDGTGSAGSTYVEFVPNTGVTLADLGAANGTPEWSWWHKTSAVLSNHSQMELRFTQPGGDSDIVLDVTAMPLQNYLGTDAWVEQPLVQATQGLLYYGNDADGTSYSWEVASGGDGVLKAVSGIIAAIKGNTDNDLSDAVLDALVLTRVRIELWETAARSSYVDEVTIDGTTYDLEPCYELVPAISMNVKTADETFTVMDAGGEVDPALVSDWMVTKGEGTGEVSIVAGGTDGTNYITVRMVTAGDCIITCNVAGLYHPVNAEKKWGEIDSTVLTAWDEDPCDEERPVGAESEHNRVIDLGTPAASKSVLVQEEVIANFLPGPVPAPAGGAKITWWLLENDEAGYAQAELEELLESFDSYEYTSGELGEGHGCGRYGDWAGDPTFIPEDLINAIYATYAASDTDFIKAECSAIADTTKTVTYTDHVWETLGEGLTNVSVEFDEVGTTGYAEPVIVVVLADYPLDKNGENAVCVEYFKFKPTKVVIPEVCQVKVPQVRWAGEKIVLEKDWGEEYAGALVGFYLEEGCIGNLIPFPLTGETYALVSGDARTALTVVDSYGVARAMLESEQQGEVDVKCVLYDVQLLVGASYRATARLLQGEDIEVIGNHGFLVYYLALEDVTVDEELSDLVGNEAGDDADVLVKVRGWFTSAALGPALDPDTGDIRASRVVDTNNDGIPDRVWPEGRWILPDDWARLAGSDEATSNLASRPQYDLMNTPGDGVVSTDELGPYDTGVRTTTPPGEADDPVIGPFNTLQPWNCVDEDGNPTNMWIADDVVPADQTVAPLATVWDDDDLRNTVVPDTTIDEFDCPMPQALVTFDADGTVLDELDKGDVFVDGTGFTAPFYAMEIPSHWLIPVGGYRWDSWGLWTASITDDGPYDFWTDLGITPNDADILEVYSDNHGYAGVTIDGDDLADECVTLDVIADFPVMAAKYPAVETDTEVCWGEAVIHLDADFEVSVRSGEAPITISFYGLRNEGTGLPWTMYGTEPYVKAEWDFDGDGNIDLTVEGATSAETLATQTFEFEHAGTYSPTLTVTDSSVPPMVDTCLKPNYIVVSGTVSPVTWTCPLGGQPLIAPNPGQGRPALTAAADCDGITVSAGEELWGILYLVETGPDAGTWLWYVPGYASSTLTELVPGEYYYVVVSDSCTLTIPQ